MRKNIALILVALMSLTMVFAAIGCGGQKQEAPATEAPATEAPATETAPADTGMGGMEAPADTMAH